MNRFAALLDRLAYEPRRLGKLALLEQYFRETPDPDRGWALAALTDGVPQSVLGRFPLRRMILDLTGRFSTGAVKHTLLAGADFRRVKDDVLIDYNFAVADTDAFNPVRPTGLAPSGDSWIRLPGTDTVSGFYLQDQLQLPQDVFAVAGLRYQRAKLTSGSEYGPDFGGGGLVAR